MISEAEEVRKDKGEKGSNTRKWIKRNDLSNMGSVRTHWEKEAQMSVMHRRAKFPHKWEYNAAESAS
jgi:hypothetical protein